MSALALVDILSAGRLTLASRTENSHTFPPGFLAWSATARRTISAYDRSDVGRALCVSERQASSSVIHPVSNARDDRSSGARSTPMTGSVDLTLAANSSAGVS